MSRRGWVRVQISIQSRPRGQFCQEEWKKRSIHYMKRLDVWKYIRLEDVKKFSAYCTPQSVVTHFRLKKRHFCQCNQTLMSLIFSIPFCDEFPSAKYFRILCPRRCNLNNISHRAAARIRIMSTVISHLTRSRGKTFLLNNKSAIIHQMLLST